MIESTLSSIILQPCTMLEFKTQLEQNTEYKNYYPNLAMTRLSYDPPIVKVTEEYVIYDMVALISAIGGTLGLCVGFSFQDFISTFLGFIEKIETKTRHSSL